MEGWYAGNVEDGDLTRPTVSEVHEVLRTHRVLLSHFISDTPMDSGWGPSPLYPDSLLRVLNRQCPGGICCSTFSAADEPRGGVNVAGSVGVLLRPASDRSVLAAAPHDIGSVYKDGVRYFRRPPKAVSKDDLSNSIEARAEDQWNEWIVDDYVPIGLITLKRDGFSVQKEKCQDLVETFGFPVYQIRDGRLVRLHGDRWIPADHGDLYP